jgi:light-regulated signal transduction histidine kinase (bacteriophytochrome)
VVCCQSFAGVQLVPQHNPLTHSPFDLTFAGLRSVHPIHLQYLRNMGVRASLSISIVINGSLWGLIACHHYRSSRYLDYESRAIAEQLGDLMATQIPHHLQRERLAQTTALRANLDLLLHNIMDANTPWPVALAAQKEVLLRLFDSTGVVIVADGKMSSVGQVPSHAQLLPLTSFLISQAAAGIYSTSHLSSVYPPAAAFVGPASGALAILLSALDGDVIVFFRPEIVSTVGWGGRPTDASGQQYLTPRNSFAVWTAEKHGHSRDWNAATADIAADLKRFLLEVKLIYLAREGEAKERSRFLFAEELRRKQIDFIDKICHEVRNPINGSRQRQTTRKHMWCLVCSSIPRPRSFSENDD